MMKLLFLFVLANSFFLSSGRRANISDLEYGNHEISIGWSEKSSEERDESKKESEEENEVEDEDVDNDMQDECVEENEYKIGALIGRKYCNNSLSKFNAGLLDFSVKMLESYVDIIGDNGSISPLGSMYLLGALGLFGKGKTKTEPYRLLNLPNRDEIECVFGIINRAIEFQNLPKGVKFYGISNYYGNIQYPFTKNFKSNMSNIIVGRAENVDFSKPDKAAKFINDQVASTSNNKIKGIIQDSCMFDKSTELVGVSGTYFTTPWKIKFELSKITKFEVEPGKFVTGKYFSQTSVYDFTYSSELCSKVIRLKYKDNKFNLLLIKPEVKFTEKKVIDRMLADPVGWYKRISKQLKPTKVAVTVPAYDARTDIYSRILIMKSTNLTTIFSGKTIQLKGAIKGDKQAGLSIYIESNILEIPFAGGPRPKLPKEGKTEEFIGNYPYLYYIFITETDTVLYNGIFSRPSVPL